MGLWRLSLCAADPIVLGYRTEASPRYSLSGALPRAEAVARQKDDGDASGDVVAGAFLGGATGTACAVDRQLGAKRWTARPALR